MASTNEMKSLLSKAAIDASFRNKLLSSPDKAAQAEGVTLTAAQSKAISAAKSSIKAGGNALNKKLGTAAKVIVAWI